MTAIKSANDFDMEGHKISDLGAPTPASADAARISDVEAASTSDRARANHTGTQLASTISNFDTQVRTNRLDQMADPTSSVDLNTQKIENLSDGTASGDAVNKGQLDTALANAVAGFTPKGSVRAVVGSNVNIASPGTTLDGLTAANGQIFWLNAQSTGSQNGPYVFNGSGSAMTRATNWDSDAEAVLGSYWSVREGTSADKLALLNNDTAITLGSSTPSVTVLGVGSSDNDTGYSANVGTGSAGPYTVTHNLNSTDIGVSFRELSGGYLKIVAWKPTDANTISVEPDETWGSNSHRVNVWLVV